MKHAILTAALLSLTSSGWCQTVSDVDGNPYSIVQIGNQYWLNEALRTTRYVNGDSLFTYPVDYDWETAQGGAYASPGNDPANDAVYGKYYNFYAVWDSRGICPLGWHIPTDAEWLWLERMLGMPAAQLNTTGYRGLAENVGGKLKATTLWEAPNSGATDQSQFSATPSGLRTGDGVFGVLGRNTILWTSTPQNAPLYAWCRILHYESTGIYRGFANWYPGATCRCIRDPHTGMDLFNSRDPAYPTFLAHADTSWSEPFKICADGSKVSKFQFICDTCDMAALEFRMTSDPDLEDTLLHGGFMHPSDYSITMSGDTLFALFRHPSYVPRSYGLYRTDTIQVIKSSTGDTLFQTFVDIYRAPVLFLHGFIANRTTFRAMELRMIQSGLYPPAAPLSTASHLLLRADHAPTSLASFFVNKQVVPTAIAHLLDSVQLGGYSAGRVDIVGHSMGGLLARHYLQSSWGGASSYRGDIQKLITLNSPHYGTQSANLLLDEPRARTGWLAGLKGYLSERAKLASLNARTGAVWDMRVDSYVTGMLNDQDLDSQTKVPSAVLATDQVNDQSQVAVFLRRLMAYAIDTLDIFYGEPSDLIVPRSSQLSGLAVSMPVVPDQWHGGASANPAMSDHVDTLICQSPKDPRFTEDGFLPGVLIYPYASQVEQVAIAAARDVATDSVTILSPGDGEPFQPGTSVTVQIEHTPGITRLLFAAIGAGTTFLSIDTTAVDSLSFTIPADAVGALDLYLLGSGGGHWIGNDETYVLVGATGMPDSIHCSPTQAAVPLGITLQVQVIGFFNGTEVDLSSLPDLTVQFNPALLDTVDVRTFRGLALGTTDVVYSYMGLTDTVHMAVTNEPIALAAVFEWSAERICAGSSVQFYNMSQGLATAYQWTFPGGTPSSSTEQDPLVSYASPGLYSVGLVTIFTNGVDTTFLEELIEVLPLDTSVVAGEGTLTAAAVDAHYQWLDCANNYAPLPNDTLQVFMPEENGLYAVEVTQGPCVDTSSCYLVLSTGIAAPNADGAPLIFPNPGNGHFAVLFNAPKKDITVEVHDMTGRLLQRVTRGEAKRLEIPVNASAGLYMVTVRWTGGEHVIRWARE